MKGMSSPADRLVTVRLYALLAVMAYLAFAVVQPFLAPLAWAVIFALMLAPLQARGSARIGSDRAAGMLTMGAAVVAVAPAVFLAVVLADEIPRALVSLSALQAPAPDSLAAWWDAVRARSPVMLPEDPGALVAEGVQRLLGLLAPRLGGLLANAALVTGQLVVMLCLLFFLLRDGAAYVRRLRSLLPLPPAEADRLLRATHDLVVASVGAGLAVAVAQGALGGVTFWLLGLTSPVVWGVAMAMCALIPVVGSALVWAPAALWLLATGDVMRAGILAVVGVGVIGMADNVLRPVLLSERAAVGGLVVFIGLLGGAAAFGFVGLVLGPVILVTAGSLLDVFAGDVPEVAPAEDAVGADVPHGGPDA